MTHGLRLAKPKAVQCEVGVKCTICSLPLLKTTQKPRWALNLADGSVKGVAHGTCCCQKLGYREWIDAKWGENPPLELIKSVTFLARKHDEFFGKGHETDENYASILISHCLDILGTRETAELNECAESPRIKKSLDWWQRGPAKMSNDRIGRIKQLFADVLRSTNSPIIVPTWKPLPLPKKDCTYLDTCDDGRIICDITGDDVSSEFCHYCRYYSKVSGVKPMEFANKFFTWLLNFEKKLEAAP